ncbi:YgaP family membrane protein [Salisediminibacterium selenitireducens]|uniref:Inner membrane protein YgaP-like transmembrane domain-containing protein n=1 Tax=Bacillus selenitireducens (strain ATCC 700615 / DSM 15326 / MLS10) TaxID=439292 RepID=D6XXB1_BACIE|nr:DUF2892 domain-containing protein [Salisediminibacterium selenitireducens]ADH97968.1 conserved hypothetical protein [[Bacillus] selenitireducens MLS10]
MKANIGSTDRAIRIVIGITLLSLYFFLEGGARWIGLVGFVPILTSFISFCPLYTLIGVNTCKVNTQ